MPLNFKSNVPAKGQFCLKPVTIISAKIWKTSFFPLPLFNFANNLHASCVQQLRHKVVIQQQQRPSEV